ncbi:Pentatricopeptide repeat-containing protein [Quillaja saponaria]|uniref:Pentatricopeptide repeat-containing protein n=1 Tax=Quillaja saponaria TaxID=32244 RepID=A0AAD7P733_QUISA|nr:Pentatricopeptide repeat-containing protein [Quillaja saponaria]
MGVRQVLLKPVHSHNQIITNTDVVPNGRRNGFGFIRLETCPENYMNDQNHDEFVSDVEKAYRILRKFHSRVPKLELALLKSGVNVRSGLTERFGAVWARNEERESQLISPQVFVILMRRFASARMVQKATEVLDEMSKYGCEPDDYVFGCLLDALCKNGSVKKAASLFEDMRIRF